jgi:hypothetical protein
MVPANQWWLLNNYKKQKKLGRLKISSVDLPEADNYCTLKKKTIITWSFKIICLLLSTFCE